MLFYKPIFYMSYKNVQLNELLKRETLRERLTSASLYLAAYELLENSIVERIKSFLVINLGSNGSADTTHYKDEVLSRNRSPIYASLNWLLEQNVIDKDDLRAYETIKKSRNIVAHEMAQVVFGSIEFDYLEQLPTMIALLKKIEAWWIINVDILTNSDFDGVEVNEVDIIPGPVIMLQLLLGIVLEENKNKSEG